MLKSISIKSLYALALAEREGVGTAYEYFAKRLVLSGWLKTLPAPRRLLIAGLPEKYGSSLDFVQIAAELNLELTIIDDRPAFLDKFEESLAAAQKEGWLTAVSPHLTHTPDFTDLSALPEGYDLAICSEVLQRQTAVDRPRYLQQLQQRAVHIALFAPNADNAAHTNLSGLSGLRLAEMEMLVANGQTDYIDMPPFPPGMTRSDDQREQATSGKLEALAMWSLGYYARMEKMFPTGIRRKQSHIVYGLAPSL